jgi:putative GTP pyrophosphokinase
LTVPLDQTYIARHRGILSPIAPVLESFIVDFMSTDPKVPRVDRITARAKDPDSFMKKTQKRNKDGTLYYSDPLVQIQDQIGARIIVFYLDDVEATCARVMKYMTVAEETVKEPESEWEFGYFGKHFVLTLPADVVPQDLDPQSAPRLFELQVRTLFQHAWSEANHDLVYKAPQELNSSQNRRCAFTAAQAWGADRIFQELFVELRPPP